MADQTKLQLINDEINRELSNEAGVRALLATTFKGLDKVQMHKAMFEGMMRGFKFSDFLAKRVYAIPYGNGYSLVTSIDHNRSVAMKSGLAGKSAPAYTEKPNGDIDTCTIMVKRLSGGHLGDYTATVYFDEYTKGRDLWKSKPRTMIAKVAEMHALRMAFPEQMEKHYVEEEFDAESKEPRMREAEAAVESSDLQMGNFEEKNGKNKKIKAAKVEDAKSVEGEGQGK